MVTACGKRGPIRPRDDLGSLPVQLPARQTRILLDGVELVTPSYADEVPLVCEACAVRWDAAEAEGKLRVMWTMNRRRQWRAHGAPLFMANPYPKPAMLESGSVYISIGSARHYLCGVVTVVEREP